MIIFYSMLNVGALNSFIILKLNINQPQMKRRIFFEELSKDLCRDVMVSYLNRIQNYGRSKNQNEYHLQIKTPKVDVSAVTGRKIVLLCRNLFICTEHSAPARCVSCIQGDKDMDVTDDK